MISGPRGAALAISSPRSSSDPAEDNPDIVHGKLDTEAARRIAAAAGITAIPTLMAFREGVLVFNQAGALPAVALAQVVASVKGLDMREVRTDIAAQNDEAAPES